MQKMNENSLAGQDEMTHDDNVTGVHRRLPRRYEEAIHRAHWDDDELEDLVQTFVVEDPDDNWQRARRISKALRHYVGALRHDADLAIKVLDAIDSGDLATIAAAADLSRRGDGVAVAPVTPLADYFAAAVIGYRTLRNDGIEDPFLYVAKSIFGADLMPHGLNASEASIRFAREALAILAGLHPDEFHLEREEA